MFRRSGVVALACTAAVAVAGCTDGKGGDAAPLPTTARSSVASAPVKVPSGLKLTPAGTELAFGDEATVAYAATQKLGTVLGLTVRAAQRGRLSDFKGFDLRDPYKKNASYFYVDVAVENLGRADLGGREVPLNGVNAEDTLLPPVIFKSRFDRCPSKRLPKTFGPGDRFRTCLVYLSPQHGTLAGVSYRPDDSVAAITWTGKVAKPASLKRSRSG